MSRKIISFLLLLLFAASTINRTIILLEYYTNRALYVKNCENKDRPTLHCLGKCQVIKKLAEEEKKDQQNPAKSLALKNEILFCHSLSDELSGVGFLQNTPCHGYHATGSPVGNSASIFHPPPIV
jgi:hypothetical protein